MDEQEREMLTRREQEMITRGMAMAADLIENEADRSKVLEAVDLRMRATVEWFG
jgi:hypothetical protein